MEFFLLLEVAEKNLINYPRSKLTGYLSLRTALVAENEFVDILNLGRGYNP